MKLPTVCEQDEKGAIICDIKGKNVRMKYCEWHLGINSSCKGKDDQEYSFPDVIFPISYDQKSGEKTYGIISHPSKKRSFIDAYEKPLYVVGKMGDLGEPGDKAVIINLIRKNIVRRISVETGSVLIDVLDGERALRFPKGTDIYYEPWFMDRGSFVFKNPSGNEYPEGEMFKLATELDIMRAETE
ncbi:MAG: hypothetical protein NTW30_02415 [Candidatus Aenigmarchaeota archaeon]|nr:hypothetical protein [Candidatus Aenigmarchaeota archaeon]